MSYLIIDSEGFASAAGPLWCLAILGSEKGALGRSWGGLGQSWGAWAALGAVLDRSWGLLGPLDAILEALGSETLVL